MAKIKSGLELGIRAEMEPIIRAADAARNGGVDCYLVPETHPGLSGVDAFEALRRIAGRGRRMIIGTGAVSVYSRYKEQMSRRVKEVTDAHDGHFWLCMGSGTPGLAKRWGREMNGSLTNLAQYTMYVKYNNPGVKVLWGVSRDKAIAKAAGKIVPVEPTRELNPDGAIFHMKTPGELKRSVHLVKDQLSKSKRPYSKFETAAIRLVYLTQDDDEWRESAGLTLANYTANNDAYTPSLERAGFGDEVHGIKLAYDSTHSRDLKLRNAAKFVSDEMLYALTSHGTPQQCAEQLYEFGKECGLKTVVAGIDAARKDYYTSDFIKNLEELSQNLRW